MLVYLYVCVCVLFGHRIIVSNKTLLNIVTMVTPTPLPNGLHAVSVSKSTKCLRYYSKKILSHIHNFEIETLKRMVLYAFSIHARTPVRTHAHIHTERMFTYLICAIQTYNEIKRCASSAFRNLIV